MTSVKEIRSGQTTLDGNSSDHSGRHQILAISSEMALDEVPNNLDFADQNTSSSGGRCLAESLEPLSVHQTPF